MESVINREIVLKLNSVWQPIGRCTVKQAIIDLCGGNLLHPAKALDISYAESEDGFDFSNAININPVSWEEWIKLPIRPYDNQIHSAKQSFRCPTVIISMHFAKMPKKELRATPRAIWERDNFTCQYTGRKLTKAEGNLDHVTPKSRGGKDSWENLVLCHKEINNRKGDRLNSEIGLKLIRKPIAPLPIPVSALIKKAQHRDWELFLH
jgi:5-methylcytosine-specific restriction endonuclease McrA